MTTTIEHLSGNALLLTIDTDLTEDQNLRDTVQLVSAEMNARLDQAEAPQTVIVRDAENMRLNFSVLVQALGLTATRGQTAFFSHPNISQVFFVTRNNLVKIAATALSQTQYAGLRASVVPTLDEALEMLEP